MRMPSMLAGFRRRYFTIGPSRTSLTVDQLVFPILLTPAVAGGVLVQRRQTPGHGAVFGTAGFLQQPPGCDVLVGEAAEPERHAVKLCGEHGPEPDVVGVSAASGAGSPLAGGEPLDNGLEGVAVADVG
jgi:hypothetical protein